MNSPNTVRQLKELFPRIEEDFIKELCAAYRDEDLDIEQIIDVILDSSEYDYAVRNAALLQTNIVGDITEVVEQSLVNNANEVKENVKLVGPTAIKTDSCGTQIQPVCDKANDCNLPLNEVLSDVASSSAHEIHHDFSNDDVISLELSGFEQKDSGATCSEESFIHILENECDDYEETNEHSEPVPIPIEDVCARDVENHLQHTLLNENKLLELPYEVEVSKEIPEAKDSETLNFDETEDCVIIYSSTDLLKNDGAPNVGTLKEPLSAIGESTSGQSLMLEKTHNKTSRVFSTTENQSCTVTNDLNGTCCLTSTILDSSPLQTLKYADNDNSNNISVPGCSKTVYKDQLCIPTNSHAIKARSRSLSASSCCSPKQASFRSSKVKNEEQRLRYKLLRQCRLSVKKEKKVLAKELNTNQSQFDNVASRYSFLCKVLPDADTKFLLAQSQQISYHQELLEFISLMLDNRNYPKSEKNEPESVKTMEKFECTVEEFLQYIPDPMAEFYSSHYNRNGYGENAEIYLQSRYQSLTPDIVRAQLERYDYNLTKVCKQLDDSGEEVSPYCLDYLALHHPSNIFFHQEVWFIEHRTEVENYLDSVIEAVKVQEELNRPPTPPPVEEVFECEICSDEIIEYSELGTCDGPLGHLFCKNCIKRNTEVRIGEGATTFPCLADCGGNIPLQTIEEVLPAQTFTILIEKIQEAERTANIPGVETCPFCPFAYGPDQEDKLFFCANPKCMKNSCRICKKEDHSPDICQMFKDENEETARHFIESKMTEALVRSCYKCGKKFVKETGSNKITCICGAKMCYICLQPVLDYSHFNGPRGENTNRCELFSSDNTVHDRPVQASARQALDEIIINNPGLNLDPTKIMPK